MKARGYQKRLLKKLELRVCVMIPQGSSALRATGTTGRQSPNLIKPLLNFIMPFPLVIPPSANIMIFLEDLQKHQNKGQSYSIWLGRIKFRHLPSCIFPLFKAAAKSPVLFWNIYIGIEGWGKRLTALTIYSAWSTQMQGRSFSQSLQYRALLGSI